MLPANMGQPMPTPAPAPQPNVQPAPQTQPFQFEPLRPQGSFNQPDPAAQGFDQFAAGQPQPQSQQPQASPELIDQLIASMRAQGVIPQGQQPAFPQPGFQPQQPPQSPMPQLPYMPNVDQALLNEQVVAERLRNLEITYSNAYQQTQDPTTKQSILLAYHGERAQLESQVRVAQVEMQRHQIEAQRAEQNRLLEPVFRVMAAQVLARELGIQDVNRVLNDPNGQPIWNPETMRINAMYLASQSAQQNIQQQAGRVIAPIPTGVQTTPDIGSFTRTASREDFMRAVDQAKRTGIRVSMSG